MTKTSTNNAASASNLEIITEDSDCTDELEECDQQFYSSICPKLSLIQFLPKEETVLKIITYSRTQK